MNKTNVTHIPEGFYADEVKAFAGQMIQQLRDNEHKGNWITYAPSLEELHLKFAWHWEQIKKGVAEGNRQRVKEHSADMANLSMKLSTQYGQ